MRVIALISLLARALALRKGKSTQWTTKTDGSRGPCAEHINMPTLPIHFPLFCTGQATNPRLSAKAYGWFSPQLKFWVDDGLAFSRTVWDFFPTTKTWTVDLNITLSEGLHSINFHPNSNVFGDLNIELLSVVLEGDGAACSFDVAPNYARGALSSTYSGFDALNRLFGPDRDFADVKKQQNYYVEETLGTNADGSISSTVVHDGLWKWMYEYSQKPADNDPLQSKLPGGMWEESLMTPFKAISLGPIPGRSGQMMEVVEPCNTLSALTFSEAAVWISCKGHPFGRDEMASVISALNALSAGTAFHHVCACETGAFADVFTMDWLMLQIYQILVKEVVNNAGDNINAEERNAILTFGYDIGNATDMAKSLTSLFAEKYDHPTWDAGIRSFPIPTFDKSVTGVIATVLWALEDKLSIPGLDTLLQSFLDVLLDLFGVGDFEYWTGTYMPAIKKALGFANICGDAFVAVSEHTLKFLLTFVEALVFQEQQIPVPKPIRDIVGWFDDLGVTSNLLSDMPITWDYYNGYDCKGRSDHATWHEKASHGLVHLMKVAELFVTRVKTDTSQC